jgi:hypothetical protein
VIRTEVHNYSAVLPYREPGNQLSGDLWAARAAAD